MRRALLLVLLLALTPHAGASEHHLAAAVAPVQTAVDGASRVVLLALPEATRDGTPDAAEHVLAQLDAFVAQLSRDWVLPENATYREATLAALPYATRAADAVADVPADAGALARIVARCEGHELTPEEARTALAHTERLQLHADALDALANETPLGVNGEPLRAASVAIVDWLERDAAITACGIIVDTTFLRFELYPARTWPGGTVRVVGHTSAAGTVALEAPSLGLAANLPVLAGRFDTTFVVPQDAPLGDSAIVASISGLEAERTLLVERAPTELRILGPARVAPGTPVVLQARLTSPLPHITDGATILVSGTDALAETASSVTLSQGRGQLSFDAPSETQTIRLIFHYEGDRITRPAEAVFVLEVVPAEALVVDEVDPARETLTTLLPVLGPLELARQWMADILRPVLAPLEQMFSDLWGWLLPAILLPLAGFLGRLLSTWWGWLLLILILLALLVLGRRLLRPRSKPSPAGATRVAKFEKVSPIASGIVALFVGLVRLMRSRGEATQATTAREAGARLSERGIDAASAVAAFEVARYREPSDADEPRGALRAWFDEARRRLTGGGA